MMSGDCQSQGLAEWLQTLGWNERLNPSDLRKLNTPKMRSIWRHLQAHVMPTDISSTVRKNILLRRLEKENLNVRQIGNFKLDSVSQLKKVKVILKIEEEKELVRDKIKSIDETLQTEMISLQQEKTVKELERNKLDEIENKTIILDRKLYKLSRDWKKYNSDKVTADTLKTSKHCTSYNEHSYQKHTVSNYVKNFKCMAKDTDDNSEYIHDMMSTIFEFKPINILDGILRNAKESLKSLYVKLDIAANIGNEATTEVMFDQKLRELKVVLIKNDLRVHESLKIKALESNELQNEKSELVKAYAKMTEDCNKEYHLNQSINNDQVDGTDSNHTFQVLNSLLEKIQEERKETKLNKEKNMLMSGEDFETLDDLRQSIISLTAIVNEMWKGAEKKVNELNKVISMICSNDLDSNELNSLIADIIQSASDFETETSEAFMSNIGSSEFTEMILKEIEVFRRIPMIALQRKWTTRILQDCDTKRILENNPSLLTFLNQTEEKNIIINVLEKYLWSLYINPQFH